MYTIYNLFHLLQEINNHNLLLNINGILYYRYKINLKWQRKAESTVQCS